MILDATKVCYRCKAEKPLTEFYADRARRDGRCSRCSVCDRELASARYEASRPVSVISHAERRLNPVHKTTSTSNRTRWRIAGENPRLCKTCGVEIDRPLWLCPPCKAVAVLEHKTTAGHRRRAERYGIDYKWVNPLKIFERDAWRCGLCHRQIPQGVPYPHPRSPSIDHIVPLSQGGDHSPVNLQAAHLRCNVAKGNRGAGFQARLFG
jgi:5-methylcytosine-specific restriction endonuclease McrA